MWLLILLQAAMHEWKDCSYKKLIPNKLSTGRTKRHPVDIFLYILCE